MFDVKGESQVSRDEINFVPSSPVQKRKVKTHAQCFLAKKKIHYHAKKNSRNL